VRVALCGLGPIGVEAGKALAARVDVELVAAADLDPAYAGRTLDALVTGAPAGVPIEASLSTALAHGVEVVVLTTSSRVGQVAPDLRTAIDQGCHVVSTCEELAAPAPADAPLWGELDHQAKAKGVTVLGTGVNPGFVMDRLVLSLAGACVTVSRVTVDRVVDAARRRGPLRRKVGEGLTVEEFRRGVAERRIGHVGLEQSARLVAGGLKWAVSRYEETIEPVVTDGSDRCLGLRQLGRAFVGDEERITLRLQMSVGAPDPHDRVVLVADPPLDVRIAGGTQGDRGTIGAVVNAVPRVGRAPRGLVTIADVFV
jgi:4-hydroxy-tetrahydrodipicolinate reductase